MTINIAKKVILVMCAMSFALAVLHTFFDQDYFAAVFCISALSGFYYLHRNPRMLMAKNWDEFCERYDNSRDKKYLWGFPAYHAVILAAILYIWLV